MEGFLVDLIAVGARISEMVKHAPRVRFDLLREARRFIATQTQEFNSLETESDACTSLDPTDPVAIRTAFQRVCDRTGLRVEKRYDACFWSKPETRWMPLDFCSASDADASVPALTDGHHVDYDVDACFNLYPHGMKGADSAQRQILFGCSMSGKSEFVRRSDDSIIDGDLYAKRFFPFPPGKWWTREADARAFEDQAIAGLRRWKSVPGNEIMLFGVTLLRASDIYDGIVFTPLSRLYEHKAHSVRVHDRSPNQGTDVEAAYRSQFPILDKVVENDGRILRSFNEC
jgi:hypothetical protein